MYLRPAARAFAVPALAVVAFLGYAVAPFDVSRTAQNIAGGFGLLLALQITGIIISRYARLGPDHIDVYRGPLHTRSQRIYYREIKGIEVYERPLSKLFRLFGMEGYGDVVLITRTTQMNPVVVWQVKAPQKVAEIIENQPSPEIRAEWGKKDKED